MWAPRSGAWEVTYIVVWFPKPLWGPLQVNFMHVQLSDGSGIWRTDLEHLFVQFPSPTLSIHKGSFSGPLAWNLDVYPLCTHFLWLSLPQGHRSARPQGLLVRKNSYSLRDLHVCILNLRFSCLGDLVDSLCHHPDLQLHDGGLPQSRIGRMRKREHAGTFLHHALPCVGPTCWSTGTKVKDFLRAFSVLTSCTVPGCRLL